MVQNNVDACGSHRSKAYDEEDDLSFRMIVIILRSQSRIIISYFLLAKVLAVVK